MKTIPLACLVLSISAAAASLVEPVNRSGSVAIKGMDPVAYFEQKKPVKGDAQFSYTWAGATWRFANASDRDRFKSDPEKYAPQFGGYCSWATAHGYTADIDPEAWSIVDGKLYLNYSKDVRAKWLKDTGKYIQDANRNWPSLHK